MAFCGRCIKLLSFFIFSPWLCSQSYWTFPQRSRIIPRFSFSSFCWVKKVSIGVAALDRCRYLCEWHKSSPSSSKEIKGRVWASFIFLRLSLKVRFERCEDVMRTNQFTVYHASLRVSDTPGLHFYDKGLTLKNLRLCNVLSSSHNPKRLTKQNLDIASRYLQLQYSVVATLYSSCWASLYLPFFLLLKIAAFTSLTLAMV